MNKHDKLFFNNKQVGKTLVTTCLGRTLVNASTTLCIHCIRALLY